MVNVRRQISTRKSPRLKDFDYQSPGAYFVTVCTSGRKRLLGTVSPDGALTKSAVGDLVQRTWESLPLRYDRVGIDTFVVMPDHFHGILWISPGDEPGANNSDCSLTNVMSAFKSITARETNITLGRTGKTLWQRSYYDRVIRTERELDAAREYILNNPMALSLNSQSRIQLDAGGASPAPTVSTESSSSKSHR